jgi:outer membrane receptor protein involved in Fe transport
MTRPICCALLLLFGLMAPLAQAQETDSTMTRTLDPITVTAERAESPLFRSTGAVAVLEAREMRQRPARSQAGTRRPPPAAFMAAVRQNMSSCSVTASRSTTWKTAW